MNKKIKTLLTSLLVFCYFASCQSDKTKSEDENNGSMENDTIETLSDSIIKSDKEKSDSILKYYQKKAEEANDIPSE